jgi:hypothetical protein
MHGYYEKGTKPTDKLIKQIGKQSGINDNDRVYELAELSWVIWYRKLFNKQDKWIDKITASWEFYKSVQPTYTQSNTFKRKLQQYSTPGTIAAAVAYFLMSGKDEFKGLVFEPSAGTGLFVSPFEPSQTWVNELDTGRKEILAYQGFAKVTNQDATQPFPDAYFRKFDVVISNPPFGGQMDIPQSESNKFPFQKLKLEHWMVANALETMKSEGRAALIIGGWTAYNEKGWISDGREFFNWLFRHYFVADIINIGSQKLYNKQGTAYPVRLILINGRKPTAFGLAPTLKHKDKPSNEAVENIFDLFQRIRIADKFQNKTIDSILNPDILKLKEAIKYEVISA